jgi:hypothetical protein
VFAGWTDFYFLLGSSAAGLIGLLFVVVTLTAGSQNPNTERGRHLFMTPVVFHFAVVLTISALCTSEQMGSQPLAFVIGAASLIGLCYMGNGAIQLRNPKVTQHWTDFWYYGALPLMGYALMLVSAIAVGMRADWASMALAAVILGFLLLGIRNAWDLVTWIAPRTQALARGEIGGDPDNP